MAISLPPDNPTGAKNTVVSALDEENSPAKPHPTYDLLKSRWEKCRALWNGTEAIREGGEDYLYKFPAESTESYEFRKNLVALFNGFQRTVKAAVGMLHETEPELGDDMPAKLVEFSEDVDMKGTHLSVYAKELCQDHVIDGMVGTLVDRPRDIKPLDASGKLSGADDSRPEVRPYFVKFLREDILKIVWGKVDGVKVRTLVVLREVTEKLEGDFGVESITQYRVYRRNGNVVTWEMWEQREDETTVTRTVDATTLEGVKRIPFSTFGQFDALPPLENLADLNIEHHNLKTNERNLQLLAMVPTQVRIGAQKDPTTGLYPDITLGPRGTIEAPFIEGLQKPIYWHSPEISVLDPGHRSIQDVKSDMGTAGLSFLSPDKRVAETWEAKRVDSAAQNASLSTVGRAEQDHLEECFGFAAEMIKEPGGSVIINTEFEDSPLTAEEMMAYLQATINGKLSTEQFIEAWKRGKRLDESLDAADEVRKILTENSLPPNPAGGNA